MCDVRNTNMDLEVGVFHFQAGGRVGVGRPRMPSIRPVIARRGFMSSCETLKCGAWPTLVNEFEVRLALRFIKKVVTRPFRSRIVAGVDSDGRCFH